MLELADWHICFGSSAIGSGGQMPCKACKSDNQQRLDGELTVTPPDLRGLKVAPVYVCRDVLICLDCGFAELVIPSEELRLLKKKKSAIDS
jgi:hypothetical protein